MKNLLLSSPRGERWRSKWSKMSTGQVALSQLDSENMIDCSPESQDLNPKQQILYNFKIKVKRCVLLYILSDAFGQSCRKPRRTLVLTFTAVKGRRMTISKCKVDKNSRTHFLWYSLCSKKWGHILEAQKKKRVDILGPVRCSDHFGHQIPAFSFC